MELDSVVETEDETLCMFLFPRGNRWLVKKMWQQFILHLPIGSCLELAEHIGTMCERAFKSLAVTTKERSIDHRIMALLQYSQTLGLGFIDTTRETQEAWKWKSYIKRSRFRIFLEMIQIYGDILEKFVPQHPLPFYHKHEIFIFLPDRK